MSTTLNLFRGIQSDGLTALDLAVGDIVIYNGEARRVYGYDANLDYFYIASPDSIEEGLEIIERFQDHMDEIHFAKPIPMKSC